MGEFQNLIAKWIGCYLPISFQAYTDGQTTNNVSFHQYSGFRFLIQILMIQYSTILGNTRLSKFSQDVFSLRNT